MASCSVASIFPSFFHDAASSQASFPAREERCQALSYMEGVLERLAVVR